MGLFKFVNQIINLISQCYDQRYLSIFLCRICIRLFVKWVEKKQEAIKILLGFGCISVIIILLLAVVIEVEDAFIFSVVADEVIGGRLFSTHWTFGIVAILLAIISFILSALSNSMLPVNRNLTELIFPRIVKFSFNLIIIGIFFLVVVFIFDNKSYKHVERNWDSTTTGLQETHNTTNSKFFNFVDNCVKQETGISGGKRDNKLIAGGSKPLNNGELFDVSIYSYYWTKINFATYRKKEQLSQKGPVVNNYQDTFSFNRGVKKVAIEEIGINNLSIVRGGERVIQFVTRYYKLIETKVMNLFVILREYNYKILTGFSPNLRSNIISVFKHSFEVIINSISYCSKTLSSFSELVKLFIEKLTDVKTVWELIELFKKFIFKVVVNLKTIILDTSDFTSKSVCKLVNNFYKNYLFNPVKMVSGAANNFVIESKLFQIFRVILDILHMLRNCIFYKYKSSTTKVSKIKTYDLVFKDYNISENLTRSLDNSFERMYNKLIHELENQELIEKKDKLLKDSGISDVVNPFKRDISEHRYLGLGAKLSVNYDKRMEKLFDDQIKILKQNNIIRQQNYKNLIDNYARKQVELYYDIEVLKMVKKSKIIDGSNWLLSRMRREATLLGIKNDTFAAHRSLVSLKERIRLCTKNNLKITKAWDDYFKNNTYRTSTHKKLTARLDDSVLSLIHQTKIYKVFDKYYNIDFGKDGKYSSDSINRTHKILNIYNSELTKIQNKLKGINNSVNEASSKLKDFMLNPSSYQTSGYSQNLELIIALKEGQENAWKFLDLYTIDTSVDLNRISIYLVSCLFILGGSVFISLKSLIANQVVFPSYQLDTLKIYYYWLSGIFIRLWTTLIIYPILMISMVLLLFDIHTGSSFFGFYSCNHALIFYKLFWVFGSIEIGIFTITFLFILDYSVFNLIDITINNFLFYIKIIIILVRIILYKIKQIEVENYPALNLIYNLFHFMLLLIFLCIIVIIIIFITIVIIIR